MITRLPKQDGLFFVASLIALLVALPAIAQQAEDKPPAKSAEPLASPVRPASETRFQCVE